MRTRKNNIFVLVVLMLSVILCVSSVIMLTKTFSKKEKLNVVAEFTYKDFLQKEPTLSGQIALLNSKNSKYYITLGGSELYDEILTDDDLTRYYQTIMYMNDGTLYLGPTFDGVSDGRDNVKFQPHQYEVYVDNVPLRNYEDMGLDLYVESLNFGPNTVFKVVLVN